MGSDNLGDLTLIGSQADSWDATCHAAWKQAGGRGIKVMDFQVWVAGDNRSRWPRLIPSEWDMPCREPKGRAGLDWS